LGVYINNNSNNDVNIMEIKNYKINFTEEDIITCITNEAFNKIFKKEDSEDFKKILELANNHFDEGAEE